jgi:GT2 family glycosyltransferase
MQNRVTVTLVNYNQRHYLPICLGALRQQTLPPAEIIIVDNASSDGSLDWLRRHASDVYLVVNAENRGYTGGHNQAIRLTDSDYVLALNCDVMLAPDFLAWMIAAIDADPSAGSACGRLYRGLCKESQQLDSTGLFPDRFRRFHDRDHNAIDYGQRQTREYVFGASGSALFVRRQMLEDVATDGQYFDETYFAYYEDVDLAWRAQRRGWNCLFVPEAIGWHAHADVTSLHSNRNDRDARFRQLLYIRNRHLCFLKNDHWADLVRDLPAIAAYDLTLQKYLLTQRPHLAFTWPGALGKCVPELLRRRKIEFARAKQEVHLWHWFDPNSPGRL